MLFVKFPAFERSAGCRRQHLIRSRGISTKNDPLIVFQNADVYRYGDTTKPIFRNLDWTLREGETWAVVGPVGSGKTTLAQTLLGRYRIVPAGSVTWPFITKDTTRSVWPQDVIRSVSFKEQSSLFSYTGHYYQQRFERLDEHDNVPTLKTYLLAGAKQVGSSEEEVTTMAQRLGIQHLLDLSFMNLSNGQVRRARIGNALLSKPEMLLLDEPLMGLDVQNRKEVSDILGSILSEGSTRILLVLRPQDEMPDCVTHVIELDKNMRIKWQGLRTEWNEDAHKLSGKGRLDLLREGKGGEAVKGEEEALVELKDVNVSYDKPILTDVNWTIRRGERWGLMGQNGSGKSTLLSLILGDNLQAYANHVKLFGKRRGKGLTLWDIKENTSFLSPELHLYFSQPYTGFQTVSTGFSSLLVLRPLTLTQQDQITQIFAEFDATSLKDKPFYKMSTGEQRLVLLMRALVRKSELVVLDEPFQGMDEEMVERCKGWLDTRLGSEQTLVFVTHHEEELPGSVGRLLTLEGGRVVEHV
ncbi:hypothetical protein HK097_004039 [Rhizophlyctis rosea]|uniref:ABC transporter domain-containing protein n=1 Tax=Rhizophlyctis rosea TaxID=64517 RepID=A0AAD5X932_9FUNG|nr:hypothetical protein HK097_004039 [Rhizophlyctis rosea]